jgi:hypothetical protein
MTKRKSDGGKIFQKRLRKRKTPYPLRGSFLAPAHIRSENRKNVERLVAFSPPLKGGRTHSLSNEMKK